MTPQEQEILRDGFVQYMKNKHDTEAGRKNTLETLVTHIQKNVLQSLVDRGYTDMDKELFIELVIGRAKREFEAVLEGLE